MQPIWLFPSDRASSRYSELLVHNTVWPELFEQKHQKNTIAKMSIILSANISNHNDLKSCSTVLFFNFFTGSNFECFFCLFFLIAMAILCAYTDKNSTIMVFLAFFFKYRFSHFEYILKAKAEEIWKSKLNEEEF